MTSKTSQEDASQEESHFIEIFTLPYCTHCLIIARAINVSVIYHTRLHHFRTWPWNLTQTLSDECIMKRQHVEIHSR